MRRKDREVCDIEAMKQILQSCDTCRLGFVDADSAYIVPLNFGFEWEGDEKTDLTLYFHCAAEGKKLDLLPKQNLVCFELDTKHKLVSNSSPCGCSFLYQSIIGKGKLEILQEEKEKTNALNLILSHYGKKNTLPFPPVMLQKVCALRLCAKELSAKAHDM